MDDFERVQTSPWEGVRNYEARNLMKEMKEGDKVRKNYVYTYKSGADLFIRPSSTIQIVKCPVCMSG